MATRYNFKCTSCGEKFACTDIDCPHCGSYKSHDTIDEIELREENASLMASLSAMTKRAEKAEAEVSELRGGYLTWLDGQPPHPFNQEWFIAETTFGDKVVLKALPKEYSYDFETADETYIKADKIKRWMQFPQSEYISHAGELLVAERDRLQADNARLFNMVGMACDMLTTRDKEKGSDEFDDSGLINDVWELLADHDELKAERDALCADNARLREALEFYMEVQEAADSLKANAWNNSNAGHDIRAFLWCARLVIKAALQPANKVFVEQNAVPEEEIRCPYEKCLAGLGVAWNGVCFLGGNQRDKECKKFTEDKEC